MLRLCRGLPAYLYFNHNKKGLDAVDEYFLREPVFDIAQVRHWTAKKEMKLKNGQSVDYVLIHANQFVHIEAKYIQGDKSRFPGQIDKDISQLNNHWEFNEPVWFKALNTHQYNRTYGYMLLAGMDNLTNGENYFQTVKMNLTNRWSSANVQDASTLDTHGKQDAATGKYVGRISNRFLNGGAMYYVVEDINLRFYCVILNVIHNKRIDV